MKTLTIITAAVLTVSVAPVATAAREAAPVSQAGPQIGAVVRGSGGVELGQLAGRRTGADGEAEIVVRGRDGRLRAVPASLVMVHGDYLHLEWSAARFDAATEVRDLAGAEVPGSGANQGPTAASGNNSPIEPGRADDPVDDSIVDATRIPTPEQQQAPDPTRPQ